MNYTFDGQNKSLAFGRYPLVSLTEARAKRDDARKLLNDGRDPVVEKRLKIEAQVEVHRNTFEKVARAWHANVKSQWARRHADDILRSLERDVFPEIGMLPISEITPPLIITLLRAIEDRGAIESAKRTRQRISAVFVFAIAEGIADKDPAEKLGGALKPIKRRGRQPAIIDLEPLRQMLIDAEDDFARPITRLALRLLALTAVRPSELRGASWTEFEGLEGSTPLWRIPAARMKGDLQRKEEVDGDHLVPLAPQSIAILDVLRTLTGHGPLLFPSARRADKPMSENAIGYLLNRAGYHGRHVPHGFRAAFSTIMNEWANRQGKTSDRAIIDLMLAHVPDGDVEAAYNRAAYMVRRRELARIWADMLCPGLAPLQSLLLRPTRERAERSRVLMRETA
jgi:integrase